jgi:hypothetical protein
VIEKNDLFQVQVTPIFDSTFTAQDKETIKTYKVLTKLDDENDLSKISLRNNIFVSKCVFNDDTTAYYVLNSNNIVSLNNNKLTVIAEKVEPKNPNYIWLFKGNFGAYYVKKNGQMVSLKPNGSEFEVGYVTFPF